MERPTYASQAPGDDFKIFGFDVCGAISAAWQATGAEIGRASHLVHLAEASAAVGQPQAGLQALALAQRLVDTTGDRWREAELYRLRGELLWQAAGSVQTTPCPAEESLPRALAIARQQQAKALELRAAMSLSRLWQCQGKCNAAHELLAEVYGWFSEGFDTADLQEARTLLEDLA